MVPMEQGCGNRNIRQTYIYLYQTYILHICWFHYIYKCFFFSTTPFSYFSTPLLTSYSISHQCSCKYIFACTHQNYSCPHTVVPCLGFSTIYVVIMCGGGGGGGGGGGRERGFPHSANIIMDIQTNSCKPPLFVT